MRLTTKPGTVLDKHGRLAQPDHPLRQLVEDLLLRCGRARDLDQRHLVHGVEEMQARDAIRVLQVLAQRCDRQRRGVARQDGRGRSVLLHLAEHCTLGPRVFDHSLDAQVQVGEALPGSRPVDVREPLRHFRGRSRPASTALLNSASKRMMAGAEGGFVGLADHHVAALEDGQLRDAGAHCAGADHADAAYCRRACAAFLLPGLAPRLVLQEQVHQVAARAACREPRHRFALVGQPGGHALLEAHANRLQPQRERACPPGSGGAPCVRPHGKSASGPGRWIPATAAAMFVPPGQSADA